MQRFKGVAVGCNNVDPPVVPFSEATPKHGEAGLYPLLTVSQLQEHPANPGHGRGSIPLFTHDDEGTLIMFSAWQRRSNQLAPRIMMLRGEAKHLPF